MRILAVDTTTPSGSVAVLEDKRLLAEIGVESASTHSVRLFSSVSALLDALHLNILEIDGFAVTPGPGSFTGIRIGLSAIKSFAFASGKPIAAVSSLKAMAWKVRDFRTCLTAPMLDAKKGEIYASLFEIRQEKLLEIVPQNAYSPDFFMSLLPTHRIVHFIGNGMNIYRRKIQDYLKDKARFSKRSPFIAREVGELGYDILKGRKGVSSTGLEPLYFRRSQAEEKH